MEQWTMTVKTLTVMSMPTLTSETLVETETEIEKKIKRVRILQRNQREDTHKEFIQLQKDWIYSLSCS